MLHTIFNAAEICFEGMMKIPVRISRTGIFIVKNFTSKTFSMHFAAKGMAEQESCNFFEIFADFCRCRQTDFIESHVVFIMRIDDLWRLKTGSVVFHLKLIAFLAKLLDFARNFQQKISQYILQFSFFSL